VGQITQLQLQALNFLNEQWTKPHGRHCTTCKSLATSHPNLCEESEFKESSFTMKTRKHYRLTMDGIVAKSKLVPE
jgi:hypothetical protein